MIIAVSGSGIGAGKTTFAERIADEVWSIAGTLRRDLKRAHPQYDWSNKSQAYKRDTKVLEWGNDSLREVLYKYGQSKSAADPAYWIRLLIRDLMERQRIADGPKTVAIDDVRKVEELDALREAYPKMLHVHVVSASSVAEPFDNSALNDLCDYVVRW